jgi:hypothetical protein
MNDEFPWWWPKPSNDECGSKYYVLWDHIGDAIEDYDALADAFLKLVDRFNLHPNDFE